MNDKFFRDSSHEVIFGMNIRNAVGTLSRAREQRIQLLSERLYANYKETWPDAKDFRVSLEDEDLIRAFCVVDGRIVSTGESILRREDPKWKAVIVNMATLKSHDGCGFGTAIQAALIAESRRRWGQTIQLVLTNNKSKGNAEFYLKNGWVPTDTTVYVYDDD